MCHNLEGALAECRKAIEVDSLCETAHVHMAHLCLQKNDLESGAACGGGGPSRGAARGQGTVGAGTAASSRQWRPRLRAPGATLPSVPAGAVASCRQCAERRGGRRWPRCAAGSAVRG